MRPHLPSGGLGSSRLSFPAVRAPTPPAGPGCCCAGGWRVTRSPSVPGAAMASFVTEVLAHSGRLEKEDLGTRISRLTRRVEEIKVKARQPGAGGEGTPGGSAEGRGEAWALSAGRV